MFQVAAQGDGGLGIFFDVHAACPSVEHIYLLTALEGLGWPSWVFRIIRALYHRNHCHLVPRGRRFDGFDMTRGIRQGCPLSPLLFAVTSHVFMTRLQLLVPRALSRAWADDVALAVLSYSETLPILAAFFHQLAEVSGLRLNPSESMLVPLFPPP